MRYNCSVCSDTDLCVNFKDSLANKHDRTHTPIKIENSNKNYTNGENSSGRESDQGRRRGVIVKERASPANSLVEDKISTAGDDIIQVGAESQGAGGCRCERGKGKGREGKGTG